MEASRACFTAIVPSWGAVRVLRTPLRDPTGVREAATITTSVEDCKSRQWTGITAVWARGLTIFGEMVGGERKGVCLEEMAGRVLIYVASKP